MSNCQESSMLVIRKEQTDVYERKLIEQFELDLIERYKNIFVSQCKYLKEKQLNKFVRYGLYKAKKNGFENKNQIFLYICLMFKIGSDFDTDLQFSWLSHYLTPGVNAEESDRILLLYQEVMNYLEAVYGENDNYFKKALSNMMTNAVPEMLTSENFDFDNNFYGLVQRTYPQKYGLTDHDKLSDLKTRCKDMFQQYGIKDQKELSISTLFMFLLGEKFILDPQFTWADKAFKGSTIYDSNNKINILFQEAKVALPNYYSF